MSEQNLSTAFGQNLNIAIAAGGMGYAMTLLSSKFLPLRSAVITGGVFFALFGLSLTW